MWGDFNLIKFYPKNWQSSMFRSMHPLLFHTTAWHYWFIFSFTIAMNLFFIYIYKSIIYQRFDVRGTKATADKRRIAWPEMLVVLIPFYWAINVVINALAYLRAFEGTCGNVILTVQVNGFQWGWKYYYHDTFYTKYLNTPVKVGYNSSISLLGSTKYINRDSLWNVKNKTEKESINLKYEKFGEFFDNDIWIKDRKKTEEMRWNWSLKEKSDIDLTIEHYFCRSWLKKNNNIENEFLNKTINKKWQHGYWITSQGLDPNNLFFKEILNKNNDTISYKLVKDPLRLLRASEALVLPSRNNLRLMACSDDITHSWAVPSLGLKMDCVPGRIFCIYLNIIRDGIYFGQCSELCGWNHYNMPIIIYAIPVEHFVTWWEIELHSVFNKKILLEEEKIEKNYKLINFKYK